MSLEDFDERILKLERETKEIIDKIRNFDVENGSMDELERYDILLKCLKERTQAILEEIEIEEVLEAVNQSLINEGYLTYEKEQ